MDNRTLIAPCDYKALDEDARTFEALTATWDMDLGDDVIHRGAFKATIAEWKKSGQVKHLLDSHNRFTIRAAVGKLLDAREESKGVWSKWSIIEGNDGDEVLARLRSGVVESMSIGWVPKEFDEASDEDARTGVVRNIRKLDWRESSLVLFPMNPAALIDTASVKALVEQGLETKALPGESLEALKELHATLSGFLAGAAAKDLPIPDELGDPLAELRLRRLRSRTAMARGGLTTTP